MPTERQLELTAEGDVAMVGVRASTGSESRFAPMTDTSGRWSCRPTRPGQLYTDDDVRLLTFVGQHIGSALSRVRASAEVISA